MACIHEQDSPATAWPRAASGIVTCAASSFRGSQASASPSRLHVSATSCCELTNSIQLTMELVAAGIVAPSTLLHNLEQSSCPRLTAPPQVPAVRGAGCTHYASFERVIHAGGCRQSSPYAGHASRHIKPLRAPRRTTNFPSLKKANVSISSTRYNRLHHSFAGRFLCQNL